MVEQDYATSLEEMAKKIHQQTIPSGFIFSHSETKLICLFVDVELSPPQLLGSISLNQLLECQMYSRDKVVPCARYAHILKSRNLTKVSQLVNPMAFLKSLSDSTGNKHDFVQEAIDSLKVSVYTFSCPCVKCSQP